MNLGSFPTCLPWIMGRSMKLATCHSMPSNHYVDKIENTIDILWLFGLNIFIHFSVLPCSSPCSSYVSHWFSLTEFETIRNRPQPQQRDAAPSHVRCASDSPGLAAVQFDQRGARPRAWRCRAGDMYCRLMQINMKDYERYAIDTQDQDRSRYAGSSCKPVSGLKQQHCQWHFLGCWNLLNNVECTANVALAGSWVVPRCRCPLDQLRLHTFALPSPDLFRTCSRLVTLTVTAWLIFKLIYGCDWSASQSGDLELRLVAKSQRARLLLPVPWSDSALDVWESAVSTHQGVITPVLVCVVWLVWVVSVSVCKWIHSGYYSKATPYTFHAAQAPFFLALHHPGDRIVRSWSKVDHRPLMPLWSFMILYYTLILTIMLLSFEFFQTSVWYLRRFSKLNMPNDDHCLRKSALMWPGLPSGGTGAPACSTNLHIRQIFGAKSGRIRQLSEIRGRTLSDQIWQLPNFNSEQYWIHVYIIIHHYTSLYIIIHH